MKNGARETALTEIVKVDEDVRRVDARTLHRWLGVRTEFSHWIRRRIGDCRLVSEQDYWSVKNDVNDFAEFWLSLSAAEMVSMMERTEKGNEARRYFVSVEEKFFRVRDELIPKLIEERDQAVKLLNQVTTPKVRRRKGQFIVTAWEKMVHVDIFGLIHETLVRVPRQYAQLSDAEKEVYAAKHRQATMTGISKAQSVALTRLTIVPNTPMITGDSLT
jgi:phage anti-repressor protein